MNPLLKESFGAFSNSPRAHEKRTDENSVPINGIKAWHSGSPNLQFNSMTLAPEGVSINPAYITPR